MGYEPALSFVPQQVLDPPLRKFIVPHWHALHWNIAWKVVAQVKWVVVWDYNKVEVHQVQKNKGSTLKHRFVQLSTMIII